MSFPDAALVSVLPHPFAVEMGWGLFLLLEGGGVFNVLIDPVGDNLMVYCVGLMKIHNYHRFVAYSGGGINTVQINQCINGCSTCGEWYCSGFRVGFGFNRPISDTYMHARAGRNPSFLYSILKITCTPSLSIYSESGCGDLKHFLYSFDGNTVLLE